MKIFNVQLIDKAEAVEALLHFSTWGLAAGGFGMAFLEFWPMLPETFIQHVSPGLLKFIANFVMVSCFYGLFGKFVLQPRVRNLMRKWRAKRGIAP